VQIEPLNGNLPMSHQDISLKAACADSFHYPNDWNPSRGSLDEYQRKKGFEHHFGKYRTKNLNKGILVIRFEMPFKVQCLRCQTYIGQGTRYDADKKKVDKYFSTPIYEFMMRCQCITDPDKSADGKIYCNQRFVIRTDPKNGDYQLVEGLRRKVETWSNEDAGTLELPDPETRRQMDSDPMLKTEKTIRNKQRERNDKERLADLLDLRDEREDAYALNCMLRRSNRERRKQEQAEAEAAARRGPDNFALPMLAADAGDTAEAKSVNFRTDHDRIATAVRRTVARAAPVLKRKGHEGDLNWAELAAKRQKLAQHAKMAKIFNSK
jgi:coiled-coil domain-containing protein 130